MAQTSYATDMTNGFPGQLAGTEPTKVRTANALEALGFGLGLVQAKATGQSGKARLPQINSVVLTLSTDLVTSNSTVGVVTVTSIVAGVRTAVATTLTATVFATDHATSLAALATKIEAVAGVLTATPVTADDTITVIADPDVEVTLSAFVTTLGSGQPTYTYTETTTDRFVGITLHKQSAEMSSSNVASYALSSAANVLRSGSVLVTAEVTVAAGDPVYLRYKDGGAGKPIGGFRNDADSGKAVLVAGAVWPDVVTAAIHDGGRSSPAKKAR